MLRPAMVVQMRMLVGRRTMARAARQRHRRRLVRVPQWLNGLMGLEFSLVGVATPRRDQGQKLSAMVVRVVSSELEKVRDAQYHCHGLTSCSISYICKQ